MAQQSELPDQSTNEYTQIAPSQIDDLTYVTPNSAPIFNTGQNQYLPAITGIITVSKPHSSEKSTSYNMDFPDISPTMSNPYIGSNTNVVYIQQTSGYNNTVIANQSGQTNFIDMYISGDLNNININQGYTVNSLGFATESFTISDMNMMGLSVIGNNNTVISQQTGLSNSAIINIAGSTNVSTILQAGNNNESYNIINGDGNALNVTQIGNNHSSNINLYGNGNIASVTQIGSAPMTASLSLTNLGGANNVNVSQIGNNSQSYSLQQTCLNPAGCNITIIQH